jgi:hypothetical protein
MFPAGFQDEQLRPAIDIEIHKGIFHGVEMARLSSKIEQIVLTLDKVSQAELVPNVGDVDPNPAFIAFQVEEVSPVLGDKAINDSDPGTDVGQSPGQVASDETQPSGDKNVSAGKIQEILHA